MFSAESQSIICCNTGGQRMLRSMYSAIVCGTHTRAQETSVQLDGSRHKASICVPQTYLRKGNHDQERCSQGARV